MIFSLPSRKAQEKTQIFRFERLKPANLVKQSILNLKNEQSSCQQSFQLQPPLHQMNELIYLQVLNGVVLSAYINRARWIYSF